MCVLLLEFNLIYKLSLLYFKFMIMFVEGCYTVDNRKPHLYFPCIRAAMTKKHGKEYQAVDVKGCDVNQAVAVKGCDVNQVVAVKECDVNCNINSTAV